MSKDLLNELATATALKSKKQTINQQRFTLAEQAKDVSAQQRKVTADFVAKAMDEFLKKMSENYNKREYIEGRYSDVFTKHVNRGTSGMYGLNNEHEKMIKAFLLARRNLNECFVNSLLENSNREQDRLLFRGTMKNLNIR